MPAELVSREAIPALAEKVTPEMLRVLERIQREGFVMNGANADPMTTVTLRALADLGLVDTAYQDSPGGKAYMWVSNGNGSRVLSYKTGIRSGPYYEIPSTALADWLDQQGSERWWNVDGDPLLTGRIAFPCPADELAGELRRINRPLLVQAHKDDNAAAGQSIGAEKLNAVVSRLADNVRVLGSAQMPPWGADRVLYLCWKDAPYEWLLTEDSETGEQMRADKQATTMETARVKKE